MDNRGLVVLFGLLVVIIGLVVVFSPKQGGGGGGGGNTPEPEPPAPGPTSRSMTVKVLRRSAAGGARWTELDAEAPDTAVVDAVDLDDVGDGATSICVLLQGDTAFSDDAMEDAVGAIQETFIVGDGPVISVAPIDRNTGAWPGSGQAGQAGDFSDVLSAYSIGSSQSGDTTFVSYTLGLAALAQNIAQNIEQLTGATIAVSNGFTMKQMRVSPTEFNLTCDEDESDRPSVFQSAAYVYDAPDAQPLRLSVHDDVEDNAVQFLSTDATGVTMTMQNAQGQNAQGQLTISQDFFRQVNIDGPPTFDISFAATQFGKTTPNVANVDISTAVDLYRSIGSGNQVTAMVETTTDGSSIVVSNSASFSVGVKFLDSAKDGATDIPIEGLGENGFGTVDPLIGSDGGEVRFNVTSLPSIDTSVVPFFVNVSALPDPRPALTTGAPDQDYIAAGLAVVGATPLTIKAPPVRSFTRDAVQDALSGTMSETLEVMRQQGIVVINDGAQSIMSLAWSSEAGPSVMVSVDVVYDSGRTDDSGSTESFYITVDPQTTASTQVDMDDATSGYQVPLILEQYLSNSGGYSTTQETTETGQPGLQIAKAQAMIALDPDVLAQVPHTLIGRINDTQVSFQLTSDDITAAFVKFGHDINPLEPEGSARVAINNISATQHAITAELGFVANDMQFAWPVIIPPNAEATLVLTSNNQDQDPEPITLQTPVSAIESSNDAGTQSIALTIEEGTYEAYRYASAMTLTLPVKYKYLTQTYDVVGHQTFPRPTPPISTGIPATKGWTICRRSFRPKLPFAPT